LGFPRFGGQNTERESGYRPGRHAPLPAKARGKQRTSGIAAQRGQGNDQPKPRPSPARSAWLDGFRVVSLACSCAESQATSPAQRAVECEGGKRVGRGIGQVAGGFVMLHQSCARPTLRCTWGVVRFERETQLLLIDQARTPLFLHPPGKPHGRKIRAMQFGTTNSGTGVARAAELHHPRA
jgi:hypothetical protein